LDKLSNPGQVDVLEFFYPGWQKIANMEREILWMLNIFLIQMFGESYLL
jgi:hypothetical protein